MSSLRTLILYLNSNAALAPQFLAVANRQNVQRTLILSVRGLTLPVFGLNDNPSPVAPIPMSEIKVPPHLDAISNLFSFLWPTKGPGAQTRLVPVASALLFAPMTKAERTQQKKDAELGPKASYDDLVLSIDELRTHNYPIHPATPGLISDPAIEYDRGTDWQDTELLTENDTPLPPKILGLDCEMCLSKTEQILARVSIVDVSGKVLLDEFVKPTKPITDYLTKYSGITAEILEGATMTFEEAQSKVLNLVSANDFLVGHSLECDLNVLKIRHPKVIDTAVRYHHARGSHMKPSLKYLAEKFLNMTIQQDISGHDSIDDALAAVNLAKEKIGKHISFGQFLDLEESIFKRISACSSDGSPGLGGHDRTCAVVDYGHPDKSYPYAQATITCADDDEVVDGIVDVLGSHDVVYARLRDVESASRMSASNITEEEVTPLLESNEYNVALEALNRRLSKIFRSVPPSSAIILLSGTGDTRLFNALLEKQRRFKKEYNAGVPWESLTVKWTDDDAQSLLKAADIARSGLSFITMT
ncbi:hypothetical protein CANCADRAFT_29263 [Tortispora caseinolytica NRRL Y-17796]|uniref:RNA exonuclease 3 n=1 Tax=Tortispora caseinolytica NRRL Y-17796 TaxID=767744 RepID=A0A1E4TBN1_9ASCO|nr:hypothetical protein CANCADRAFT_29263 [Tortispora caseinolytica NRRL Y-17796]